MKTTILLHGALGAQEQLLPLRAQFAGDQHDVFTLNLPGHGGATIQGPFGIETFAEGVMNFVRGKSNQQVNLFGYSMGGYVALWLAYLYPSAVRHIVTLGTKFDWSPESARREVLKLNPNQITEKVPAFARILEHRHAPQDWKSLVRMTNEMMTQLGDKPLITTSILLNIRTRVLVLLGDQDDMADPQYSEEVANHLPEGSFKLLPQTTHPIEKVNLQQLTAVALPFLLED
jgi:pimeloyl-ACP methyl ester carboxylesterase